MLSRKKRKYLGSAISVTLDLFAVFTFGLVYFIGELQKQIADLKSQMQRLEQDNARQEGEVSDTDFSLTVFAFVNIGKPYHKTLLTKLHYSCLNVRVHVVRCLFTRDRQYFSMSFN